MARIQASLITIETTIVDLAGNLWTGIGDLTYNGTTYQGIGNVLNISAITNSAKQQSKRVKVSFDASETENRNDLLLLDASARIRVNDIFSDDNGATWQSTGLRFVGQVSNPNIDNNFVFSCEIETARGLERKGNPVIWSNQAQLKRHPGDECFKYLEKITTGIESRWG